MNNILNNETSSSALQLDKKHLNCNSWALDEPSAIKTSLRLDNKGKCGSDIKWSSNKKNVISDFGRVIRPNWDKEPENVTMTATLTLDSKEETKTFNFNVIPQEKFVDPQYISDSDFFGEWKDGELYKEGNLDYSNEALESVHRYAKEGNYLKAKEELFEYFQNREYENIASLKCNTGVIDMMLSNVSTLQRCDRFYKGEAKVTTAEFQKIIIPLQTLGIKNGSTITYDITSKYNEIVGIKIASDIYPDETMRPTLSVKTKKTIRVYVALDTATIAAGINTSKAIGKQPELYSKMFGEFLENETFHSLIKFHIEDLAGDDEILEASLSLHIKKDIDLEGEKEVYVIFFAENTWDGDTVKWNDFKWQFSSHNGIPEGSSWSKLNNFDFEHLYQSVRFMHFPWVVEEYKQSKDEKYLYYLIQTTMDFIYKKGNLRTYPSEGHGPAWFNENTSRTLCGGWPRGLDAAVRLVSFSKSFDAMVRSRYMTAEVCTAILKYICDSCDGLAFKSLTVAGTNIKQHEAMNLLESASLFKEFKDCKKWIDVASDWCESMIFEVSYEDGTYKEATGGYSHGVCSDFIKFKKSQIEKGLMVSNKFDDQLKKLALYNVLLEGPDGESVQYGDQSSGIYSGWRYPELIEWFKDEELNYILSRGECGKRPKWTSYIFPQSGATMLRSDWKKDAVYLWTQARGGGAHGHEDDHHITLIANNRILLTDAGIFTYSAEDPFRKWATSPVAHNTVSINNLNQLYNRGFGTQYEGVTSEFVDFISQGTKSYEEFEHIRTISYIKPDIFIVSDRIIPIDRNKPNDYKQLWHMLPTAKLSIDMNNRVAYSNYQDGANILIASVDNDVKLEKEAGWYDYSYQQLAENPFVCFIKTNTTGITTFDTVLQVCGDVNSREINTEEIDLGVSESEATAFKIVTKEDDISLNMYYMLDYSKNITSIRQVDKYKTDAKMMFVKEDSCGNILELSLIDAKFLLDNAGNKIINIGDGCKYFNIKLSDGVLLIDSCINKEDLRNVNINLGSVVDKVLFNGESITFTYIEEGAIKF